MYTGNVPYEGNSPIELYRNIIEDQVKFDQNFDYLLENLLANMLMKKVEARLAF